MDNPVYEKLSGEVPVFYAPGLENLASEVRGWLEAGASALPEVFGAEVPALRAVLVSDDDWNEAPRENARPYPSGLPYFTRSTEPPTLVLPEELSPAIRPRTQATFPLAVWHELSHAFVLQRPLVKTPAWLRELLPQAASAAVAKREEASLERHLEEIEAPGFTVREFGGRASAEEQMAFQNLLLSLGAAAVETFGEGFLKHLVHALWDEAEVVNEARAEELLAGSLGPGGREWLEARPEF